MMELRQLRYFIKAAELSNFTEAANTLFISQSTLSQQIQQLENELNTPLFDRIAKRVRLTEAGKLFLPAAKKTVRDSEEGKQMLKDLNEMAVGTVTVGLTYGMSNLFIQALKKFAEDYPKILVRSIYGTSDLLTNELSEGRIDFILSFVSINHDPSFVSLQLFKSDLSLIVAQDNPMALKANIGLAELQNLPLALPVSNFSIRNFLEEKLARHHLTLDIRMEANDIHTLLQMAEAGIWNTILMASSIFDFPKLKAIPIIGKEFERSATLIWFKEAYQKKAALIFIEMIQKHATNLGVLDS